MEFDSPISYVFRDGKTILVDWTDTLISKFQFNPSSPLFYDNLGIGPTKESFRRGMERNCFLPAVGGREVIESTKSTQILIGGSTDPECHPKMKA